MVVEITSMDMSNRTSINTSNTPSINTVRLEN